MSVVSYTVCSIRECATEKVGQVLHFFLNMKQLLNKQHAMANTTREIFFVLINFMRMCFYCRIKNSWLIAVNELFYFAHMERRKRVLVAPLDWGLGHATRCIPIIDELLKQDAEVFVGAYGDGLLLLKEAYPQINFVDLLK